MAQPGTGNRPKAIRLDLWLYHARLCKSRALAARLITAGGFRINGEPTRKPHRLVRPGDVVTCVLFGRVRVLHILALGERRGPASEARALYCDDAEPVSAPTLSEPKPLPKKRG